MQSLDAVSELRSACHALADDQLDVPLRVASNGGSHLVMTARHRLDAREVRKVVTIAGRSDAAQPRVTGDVYWTDHSGTRWIADAAPFTALRTAAMSALAAETLTRGTPTTLVVFGSGIQAAAHIRVYCALLPISDVVVIGRTLTGARATVCTLAGEMPGVHLRASLDVRRQLEGADIICCATTSARPLFDAAWVPDDIHVAAVGSHTPAAAELPADLFARASAVVVDDVRACLAESGEVRAAVAGGFCTEASLVGLPQWVAESRPAPTGITIYKSVGTAAADWVLAHALDQAQSRTLSPVGEEDL